MNPHRICIDPGFGGLKAAEINGTGLQTYWLPAQVGLAANTDQIQIGLGGVTSSGVAMDHPLQVDMPDGSSYLVGHNIAAFTTAIPQMDFNRFSDSIELRANLYGLFSRVFDSGRSDTSILLTLPVEALQPAEMANQVERGVKAWLVGEHSFQVNGQPFTITVHRVRCKMPQPVAIWCDWGFDFAGSWMRGSEALKAPYLIIDPGFNTLDMVLIQNRQIITRLSGGEKFGMRIAAQRLAQLLKDKYDLGLDLYQADELIKMGRGAKKISTYVGGQPVDISPLVRQAFDSLKADSLAFVEAAVKNAAASKNIMAGGGAILLGPALAAQFKGNLETLPDPVMAGARGGSKIAARPGFLG